MPVRTALGARALEARYFLCDEIFALEEERIFARRWLYAGHVAELPDAGRYLRFDVARSAGGVESLIVVRGGDRELRAFFNVCRHRGSLLCGSERGRARGVLTCPYHAWSYGLDGSLRATPNMEGADLDPREHALVPASVVSSDGLLFLALDPDPEPFSSSLGALAGRFTPWRLSELVPVARRDYEVEANWKLFFENYSECYHCPGAHPALHRLTDLRASDNDLVSGPVLGGPTRLRTGVESMTAGGKACASPLSPDREQLRRVYYYTVFPNLFISLCPDYVLIHRLQPLTTKRTRISCSWLFDPDAADSPGFDPSPAVDFWDRTNLEDWELCRNVQLGISSRAYSPGPYSGFESMTAAFDREYLLAIGDPEKAEGGKRRPSEAAGRSRRASRALELPCSRDS